MGAGTILVKEIPFAGPNGLMTTDPNFTYDILTGTLTVTNLVAGSLVFDGQTVTNFATTGNTTLGDAAADSLTINATTSVLAVATFGTDTKLQFRNTNIFLNSGTDGILTISASTSVAIASAVGITSAGASAFAVGLAGATNPSFVVDSSVALQAAGLKLTGAIAAGTVAMAVISSGADASLTINAKGTGTIGIGSVSTGAVTITPATTITGALTLTAGIAEKVIKTSTETIAAGGTTTALDLTKYHHDIDADAGGDIFTLANGVQGQETVIVLKTATGVATITPATFLGGTSITLNAAGDSVLLRYQTTLGWSIIGGNSYAVV